MKNPFSLRALNYLWFNRLAQVVTTAWCLQIEDYYTHLGMDLMDS